MDFIALLPMKANSERVKNKNIKDLCGKPLFFYIADTLRSINQIKLLVINTDSLEIEKLAKERYGDWVKIHKRPEFLRGDNISMNKIIDFDVKKIGTKNLFLQTHSTNPLLKGKTLCDAIDSFYQFYKKDNDSSLFSANVLKSRLYFKSLMPINHDPDSLLRTQDLDDIFEENSCFYIFSGDTFIKNNHRISSKPHIFPMARNCIESIDIDNHDDWLLTKQVIISQELD